MLKCKIKKIIKIVKNVLKTGSVLRPPLALLCVSSILVGVIILPILGLFGDVGVNIFNALSGDGDSEIYENLSHFFNYLFLKYISSTFIVLFFTLIFTLIIGVSSAYLVANFTFFGSKILENLLILPLAIPAYILAFVYVGLGDFGGILHDLSGVKIDFFNTFGVVFALSLSLFPYIYLFARTSFKSEAVRLYEAALIMGLNEWAIFWRLGLWSARPAIIAGAMLVVMETLSDYGAAAYLGVDTFSAGIFKLWYDLGDISSASTLSAFLMLFIFALIYFEYWQKSKRKYSFDHDLAIFIKKRKLGLFPSLLAFIWCSTIAILGFILPFGWLVYWGLNDEKIFLAEFWSVAGSSALLAAIAAICTVILAAFICFSARISRSRIFSSIILKLASIGYAIPGAAIGVAIMIAAVAISASTDKAILGVSYAVLIAAFMVRFLATAIYSIEGGYDKLSQNIDEAALSFKRGFGVLAYKIHWPLLKHFLFLAFVVVFIDTIKELPLTRMLSPFGFETLSVRAFWYASDERIYDAALPALAVVLVSLVAVIYIEICEKKYDKN